jgi:hypothetical protein
VVPVIVRRRILLPLALVLVALAGCSNGQSAAGPTATAVPTRTLTPSPTATVTTVPTIVPAQSRAVAQVVADMQHAYAAGDWSSLRATFASQRDGQVWVQRMQNWKTEDVKNLVAALVYRRPLGNGRFIGTVEFTDDLRAPPSYAVYIFQKEGSSVRIVGTTTGIHGNTYRDADWSVTTSRHFVFYHSPYELQGRDRRFIADLEYQRAQFIKKFGVNVAPVASYYFYPEQRLMAPMTSHVCGTTPEYVGCADAYENPPTIQTSIWPTFHEPIHVYERALTPSPRNGQYWAAPLFIGEGLAVALEDKHLDPRVSDYCSDLSYVPLDACAEQALPDVKPLSLISDAGFKKTLAGNAYLLAGSFVKYMLLTYGYHRFGRFYYVLAGQPRDGLKDYNVATESVYHRTIQSLLAGWQAGLCHTGC